jgi:hypothetical protein
VVHTTRPSHVTVAHEPYNPPAPGAVSFRPGVRQSWCQLRLDSYPSASLTLCVPKTSSTSSEQAIFPDRGTSVSLSSDAVLLKIDRFGQRFQRRGAVQGAVRAVLIVVGFVLVQDPPQTVLAPDRGAVQEFAEASSDPASNAYDERFVLTTRTEVTDRMLILGGRHLRTVLAQYAWHYNGPRPHRSRQRRPPPPDHPVADLTRHRIQRRAVLGGRISEYERAA